MEEAIYLHENNLSEDYIEKELWQDQCLEAFGEYTDLPQDQQDALSDLIPSIIKLLKPIP
jgi:hypothetical protein